MLCEPGSELLTPKEGEGERENARDKIKCILRSID